MSKTKTSESLSRALSMLRDRGIRCVGIYKRPPIKGYSAHEKYIITSYGQIISNDDIPEDCEVIYAIIADDKTYSFMREDPASTSKFFAMVFEKKERRVTDLEPIAGVW